MLTVEFTRRRRQSAFRFECLAVIADAEASIYAVLEDGSRKRLGWRVGDAGSAWRTIDGSRVWPPKIHDPAGSCVLHLGGQEYAAGAGEAWTLEGRTDTPLLNLRRQGDRLQTAYCFLGPNGWARTGLDLHQGVAEIMLAPEGFSLEELHLALSLQGTRGRVSALAG